MDNNQWPRAKSEVGAASELHDQCVTRDGKAECGMRRVLHVSQRHFAYQLNRKERARSGNRDRNGQGEHKADDHAQRNQEQGFPPGEACFTAGMLEASDVHKPNTLPLKHARCRRGCVSGSFKWARLRRGWIAERNLLMRLRTPEPWNLGGPFLRPQPTEPT